MTKPFRHLQTLAPIAMLLCALLLAGCAQATAPQSATAVPTTTTAPIAPTPTLVPLSLATRKGTFEAVWTLVNNRYVHAGFGGVDWNAVRREFAPKVEAEERASAFYALLKEMIARLPGEDSYFQTPQEVAAATAPEGESFYGIGAQVMTVPE